MERRRFLKNGLAVSAATLLSPSVLNATGVGRNAPEEGRFHLNYAFHEGMFRNLAGDNFIDQIKFGYEQGFRAIEDNGMMDRSAEQQKVIGDTLSSLGMQMGVFVITSDGWHWKTSLTTGKKEWIEKMERDCKIAVEVAKRCNAKWVTVVPGNFDRSQSIEFQTSHVIEALRRAADILEPHGLVMVLEALSDNPDLFLRHSHQTYMICKAVGSAACKILYDIYHMQRNEGNLITNMEKVWDEIGYIQIGDNPGRNEPSTGEINYDNIFKYIYNKGYKGIMGMEHGISGKGKEGELALINAYRNADNFL